MTPDQISLYDSYRALIEQATTEDTEAAAAMAEYQTHVTAAQTFRAQAKVIAAQLGITTC